MTALDRFRMFQPHVKAEICLHAKSNNRRHVLEAEQQRGKLWNEENGLWGGKNEYNFKSKRSVGAFDQACREDHKLASANSCIETLK